MKHLIYTETIENALMIAANLGGIQWDNTVIKEKERRENEEKLIRYFSEQRFIQTVLPFSKDLAVVIWGEKMVTTMSLEEYGNGESIDECVLPSVLPVKPTRGNAAALEHFTEILSNNDFADILDASKTAKGTHDLIMICQGYEIYKDIQRIPISPFTPENILEAFKKPLDIQASYRLVLREKTKQLIYYLVNANYPRFVSGYKKYLLAKDFPIVNQIIQREDEIEKCKATISFPITIEGITKDGEVIVFTSKQAVFSSQKDANKFINALPESMPVTVSETKETIHCQGPHSAASIERAAKTEYGISPQETQFALSSLKSLGYVSNITSSERKIPQFTEDEMREVIQENMAITSAFENVLGGFSEFTFDSKVISEDRKSGILPTRKIMRPGTMDETKKKIYYLICQELVKTVLGPCIIVNQKAEIIADGITFNASGKYVLQQGHSIFDKKDDEISDIPSSLKSGDLLTIRASLHVENCFIPKPYTKQEIAKNFGQGYYSEPEIHRAIERLTEMGFIKLQGEEIIPTNDAKMIISSIRKFSGLIDAPMHWEESLNQIGNNEGELLRIDAENKAQELINDVRNALTDWMATKNNNQLLSNKPLVCPRCGARLVDGSFSIYCKRCNFQIRREYFTYTLTDEDISSLINDRQTGVLRGLTTPDGTTFTGVLFIDKRDGKVKCAEIIE